MIASFYPDGVVIFGGKHRDMTMEEDPNRCSSSPPSIASSGTCSSFSEETTVQDCLQAPLPYYFPVDNYDSDISYCYSEEVFGDSDVGNLRDFDNVNDKDCLLDIYGDFPHGLKLFKAARRSLSKQDWKQSWPKEGELVESVWVNVYGFFDEYKGYGGHGVVVRNMSAKPIAASVYFSLRGVSYVYQVFKGIDAGLRLALKHGCSRPHVVLNSKVVVHLLSGIASGIYHRPGCKSLNVNNVCKSCTRALIPYMGEHYFKNLETLFGTLIGKIRFLNFTWQPRNWNKAAYYLAKQAKRTLLIYGGAATHYKADLEVEKFPEDLLDILWSDAYDSVYYNLNARAEIFDGAVPRLP